jgi:hypothetical protein
MKKLITLLTALTMMLSLSVNISAKTITANPVDVLMPYYISFERYGFTGYYNMYYFDSNNCVYEFGDYAIEDDIGYRILEEDGVWYMYSKHIEGEEEAAEWLGFGWKKAPLADVLAATPRYEYKMADMIAVQRFFKNQDLEININEVRCLDYNADKKINALDLSLIKYELMH